MMFLVLSVTLKAVNLPTSSSGSKVMVSMSTGDSSLPLKAAGEDRTCSYNLYTKGKGISTKIYTKTRSSFIRKAAILIDVLLCNASDWWCWNQTVWHWTEPLIFKSRCWRSDDSPVSAGWLGSTSPLILLLLVSSSPDSSDSPLRSTVVTSQRRRRRRQAKDKLASSSKMRSNGVIIQWHI